MVTVLGLFALILVAGSLFLELVESIWSRSLFEQIFAGVSFIGDPIPAVSTSIVVGRSILDVSASILVVGAIIFGVNASILAVSDSIITLESSIFADLTPTAGVSISRTCPLTPTGG